MEYSHFRLLKTNATFKRHIKCMDTTICPRIHWFISCAAFVSSTGVKLRRESLEGAYSFLSWLAMVISLPRAQSGYLFCASSGTQGFLLWMVRSGILEARNSSLEFWPWKCHLPLAMKKSIEQSVSLQYLALTTPIPTALPQGFPVSPIHQLRSHTSK